MSLNSLTPLIKKTGSFLSPEEFQKRINVVFHDYESDFYDRMHHDMWGSLQEQINLLVEDFLKTKIPLLKNLKLLDIGCGTGLSTQILLNSKLGRYIENITLLDTSPKMLKHAEAKAANWNKKYSVVNGYVSDLNEKYDIIIICSVLHHIPDLEVFLDEVDKVLNPGGILIHLQDPNGNLAFNDKYIDRVLAYNSEIKPVKKTITDYFPKQWKQFINNKLGRKNYIDLINDTLISENVITRRMSADEIWSVTDIHVETKQNLDKKGITLELIQSKLQNFDLINQRSYGFYGVLKSALSEEYKKHEEQLISENDLSGRNISCIWIKKLL